MYICSDRHLSSWYLQCWWYTQLWFKGRIYTAAVRLALLLTWLMRRLSFEGFVFRGDSGIFVVRFEFVGMTILALQALELGVGRTTGPGLEWVEMTATSVAVFVDRFSWCVLLIEANIRRKIVRSGQSKACDNVGKTLPLKYSNQFRTHRLTNVTTGEFRWNGWMVKSLTLTSWKYWFFVVLLTDNLRVSLALLLDAVGH